MSLGALFALTEEDEAALLSLNAEAARRRFIAERIAPRYLAVAGGYGCETLTAWDAIHRCFDGGELTMNADSPLHMAILGGTSLYRKPDFVLSYKTADDVADIDAALEDVTHEEMAAAYGRIDPDAYGAELSAEDWDTTWGVFETVQAFYKRAAAAGRAVVFVVEQ